MEISILLRNTSRETSIHLQLLCNFHIDPIKGRLIKKLIENACCGLETLYRDTLIKFELYFFASCRVLSLLLQLVAKCFAGRQEFNFLQPFVAVSHTGGNTCNDSYITCKVTTC